MALTLTATITETQTAFRVTGTVPATVDIGYRFRLGDELLEVRSFGRKDISILNGHATQNVRDMNAWAVSRHLEDTVAAGHDAGTAVLGSADAWVAGTSDAPPEPWAGPGGGSGPALSDATPEADAGSGDAGTSPDASRGDHAHPTGGATPSLAEVLAVGNDTGGSQIVSIPAVGVAAEASLTASSNGSTAVATTLAQDTTTYVTAQHNATVSPGSFANASTLADAQIDPTAAADASITANAVDGAATVTATATASGTGQAFASSRAEDGSGSSGEVTVSAASDARATLHATGASGGLALATSKADSVDLAADVSATATTTGGGNPKANRTAEATDTAGNAEANTTANAKAQADGNTTVHSLNNRAAADVDVQSGGSGDATALRGATANGSGGANVSSTALVLGAGTATNVVTATAVGGTASIGPVADATSALVMVTGLPTSDPEVAGALYSLNGVVMVSAG